MLRRDGQVTASATRVALVMALLAPAALAFPVTKQVSEFGFPDVDHLVWVQDVPDDVRAADVVAAVEHVVTRYHADIAKDVFDYRNPLEVRHLYVAGESKRAQTWLETHSYPDFSADIRTSVHPLDELPENAVRGYFNVYGPASAAQALATDLGALGVGAVAAPYPALLPLVFDAPTTTAATVALLALAVLAAFGVFANTKRYGVQRLQGRSFGGMLADDSTTSVRMLASWAIGINTTVLLGLLFYNGWDQVEQYLQIVAILSLACIAVVVATHIATLGLLHRVSIVGALKGEFASKTVLVLALAARLTASVVAVTALFGAIATGGTLEQRQRATETIAAVGESVYLMVDGSVTLARESLDLRLAEAILEAETHGEIVVCASHEVASVVGDRLYSRSLLIVNQAYLDRYPVRAADGRAIVAQATEPLLIVPGEESEVAELRESVADWVSMVSASTIAASDFDLQRLAPGQRATTFGDLMDPASTVDSPDPVLLVLPTHHVLFGPDSWSAWATTGDVFFTDPVVASEAIDAAGLGSYIVAFNPVARNAATDLRLLAEQQRLSLLSAVVAAGVVVLTGVVASLIYVRRSAQAIFVKYTHGIPFWKTHGWVIVVEVSLLISICTWWAAKVLQVLDEGHTLGPRSGPPQALAFDGAEPLIAGVVLLSSLGAMLATVAVLAERAIAAKHSHT